MKSIDTTSESLSAPTALGRPIDPKFASNRLAMAVMVGSGLAFGAYNLAANQPLATSWFGASVSVFLAWAIGREVDPDNNLSASIAMVFAFTAALLWPPSLLFGGGLLMAVRLTTGTVGVRIKPFDMAVLVALGALLGTGAVASAALPALAIGVMVAEKGSRRGIVLAVAVAAAGVIAAIVGDSWQGLSGPEAGSLVLVGAVLLAALVTVPAKAPTSTTDFGAGPLAAWRITLTRIVAAITLAAAWVLAGDSGIEAAAGTGGAAILGVAVVRFLPRKEERK